MATSSTVARSERQLLVSGLEPVRRGCPTGSAGPNSVNYPNTEVEPFVAVNPINSKIIGVFQQDRWNDGGAKALVAARSADGASWTRNSAQFSACSGGAPEYERTSDPWVSYDRAGKAYQIALSVECSANALRRSRFDIDGRRRELVDPEDDRSGTTTRRTSTTRSPSPATGLVRATHTQRGFVTAHPSENLSDTGLAHSFAFERTADVLADHRRRADMVYARGR